MEINNPQSFDHIIGINGEILQPKVLAYGDVEPSKIHSDTIIWRKTTADEFHVPPALLEAGGRPMEIEILPVDSVDLAKVQAYAGFMYDRKQDIYYVPSLIIDRAARKLSPYVESYATLVGAPKHNQVASVINAETEDRHLPGAIIGANENILYFKVIEIGPWNMDAVGLVNIAHGLTTNNIRTIDVLIIPDIGALGDVRRSISIASAPGTVAGRWELFGGDVRINRFDAGWFDTADYNDGVMNRGFITIWYQD